MRPTANYQVLVDQKNFVLLLDVGPWDKFKTITNAAEDVVFDQHIKGLGNRKLFYVDSSGDMTRLIHNGEGKFIDFAPALDPRGDCREMY